MTLNDVMALILRYFTKFGTVASRVIKDVVVKKVHVC